MSEEVFVSKDPVAHWAEQQEWMSQKRLVKAQEGVRNAFGGLGAGGEKLKDILHGKWLHEPAHAVLTDIPLGAWTAAVVLDAVGAATASHKMDVAADAAIAVGLAGAAGAALTGVTDWSEIKDETPRRIGAIHACLNVGATALFLASCVCRKNKERRSLGRSLAVMGFVVASASAHLGGNLVYEHRIGVQEQGDNKKTQASSDEDLRPRDPEDRIVDENEEESVREKNHDKTLADSFPTSDPPSSIPDPSE